MIKLNLMPKVVDEQRALRNTAILFAVLLVAIIVGALVYVNQTNTKLDQLRILEQEAKLRKENVDRIKAAADEWNAKIPPVQSKVDFVNSVLTYTDAYPKLYEEIARWTYEKVQYTAFEPKGSSIEMSATTKSLDDLGRYLLNMYRATDLFTEVRINGVPGYGSDGTVTQEFSDVTSSSSTTSGGMTPEQFAASFPGREVPAHLRTGAAVATTSNSDPANSLSGMGAIGVGVIRQPGALIPRIINFKVTCVLKDPIAVPAIPGAAPEEGT